jgi:glycosyltransferase involved in cell wall biosynthesis
VGRLSAEKGIAVLVEAWKELADIPLVVAGDGPMAGAFQGDAGSATDRLKPVPPFPVFPQGANWVGRQPREAILELMREARVLIVPSVWYEGGPLTVLEAFACGLPVIASNLGSMAEAVAHERTGLLFEAGDAADLARKVRRMFANGDAMRAAARREFEEKYTAERNYEMLTAIYETAIANFKRERRAAS